METPQPEKPGLTKRNKKTLLIAIAAVALCCVILAVAGIALYSWDSIQGGQPQGSLPMIGLLLL